MARMDPEAQALVNEEMDKAEAEANKKDDEQLKKEDEEVTEGDDSQQETEEAQETTEETEQEQTTETTEEDQQEETVEQEERKPSRREQLRIQQILEKREASNQPTQREKQDSGINYRDMIDADDGVYEDLEKKSQDYGEQQYQRGLQQAQLMEFRTGLRIDTPAVRTRHEILDPDSPKFKPEVFKALNDKYLDFVGYNPGDKTRGIPESVRDSNTSYADYIDAEFEMAQEIANQMAEEQIAKTTKNIKRQAAQTGLRPDGSSSKKLNLNKPIQQMSDEELKAYGQELGLA